MALPQQIDPATMARLLAMYQNYRPGETSAPSLNTNSSDPTFGYHLRYGEPTYNGEGSQLSMGAPTGYSAGNYDTARGGNMQIYDTSGKDTGQSEQWKPDDQRWMDTAAMLAGGGFGAGFAALAAGLGGAAGAAGAAEGAGAGIGGGAAEFNPWAMGFTDTGTAGGALDAGYAGSGALTGAGGMAAPAGLGGSGAAAAAPAAAPASNWLSQALGVSPSALGLGASVLGGLLGANQKDPSAEHSIPDWIKGPAQQAIGIGQGLLTKQMAPGYLQGYDDMRSMGQGLLNGQTKFGRG